MLASDPERERAAATLQQEYVSGRLTLEELSDRTAVVLAARSRAEVRGALADLPILTDARELVARGRSLLQAAVRGALLVLFTGAYLVFSVALLLALLVTLAVDGASGATLIGFLVVWLVPTYLLFRVWHPRTPGRLRRPRRA